MTLSGNRLVEHASRLDHALRVALRARPRMLTTARAAGLNEQRLEVGDVDALEQIALVGERSMSDLAGGLRVDPSTATRAVDRLVDRGLVVRRRDATDARRMIVALTEAGMVTQTEAAKRRTGLAVRLVKRFADEDQDEVGRLFPMLAAAIDDVLGVAHRRMSGATSTNEPPSLDASDRELLNARALGGAWQVMRREQTGIVAYATRQAPGLGLEVRDVDTLDQIAMADGTAQMSEVAAGLGVVSSSATKAVGRLIARGLVLRTQDSDDRRVFRVSLTEAGVRALALVSEGRLEFAVRVIERFEVEDQETIGRLLALMAEAVTDEFGPTRSVR